MTTTTIQDRIRKVQADNARLKQQSKIDKSRIAVIEEAMTEADLDGRHADSLRRDFYSAMSNPRNKHVSGRSKQAGSKAAHIRQLRQRAPVTFIPGPAMRFPMAPPVRYMQFKPVEETE